MFRSFSHFLIGLFVFLVLNCMNCFIFLKFLVSFSHSEACLFTLFVVSFTVQKLLSLIRFHLFIFVFMSITLGGGS